MMEKEETLIVVKKIFFIFFIIFILGLFFVIKFGYYNIIHSSMPTYQEHQIYLSNKGLPALNYKYYPVDGKLGEGIICENKEKCYVFYATLEEQELTSSQNEVYDYVHRHKETMKVQGISIPIYKMFDMKYIKFIGEGKISFLEPKL